MKKERTLKEWDIISVVKCSKKIVKSNYNLSLRYTIVSIRTPVLRIGGRIAYSPDHGGVIKDDGQRFLL